MLFISGGAFLVIKVFLCLFLMYQYPQERARVQCEYELAQRIEMLRNLPYEQPRAQEQMGQGQENRVYLPQEQVQEQPDPKMSARDGWMDGWMDGIPVSFYNNSVCFVQVVTVINDLGPHPFNFFGNGNSEYQRNKIHG